MHKFLATCALATTVGCATNAGRPSTTLYNECNPPPIPAVLAGGNGCSVGWHAEGWPEGSPPKSKYIQAFPKDCYVDFTGNTQCYFSTAEAACEAVVKMNDTIETQNMTKFLAVDYLEPTSDPDQIKCHVTGLPDPGQYVPLNKQNKNARNDDPPNLSGPTVTTVGVAGPYSDQQVNNYTYGGQPKTMPFSGASYNCTIVKNEMGKSETLRNLIVRLNKTDNAGVVKSDLAGFKYPKPAASPACADGTQPVNGLCTEPAVLTETANLPNSAQVHHIVPRTAKNTSPLSCIWGKNSTANAAVISAQLNQFFTNNNPPFDEIKQLNNLAKHGTVVLQ